MTDNQTPSISVQDANEKIYVIILHGLYLASAFTGISSIIGLVMAYIRRDSAQEWSVSHYTYAIRTFWIGLFYGLIGFVLIPVVVGFFILFAVYIWFIIRSIIPAIQAMQLQPMRNPRTWAV